MLGHWNTDTKQFKYFNSKAAISFSQSILLINNRVRCACACVEIRDREEHRRLGKIVQENISFFTIP